MQKQTSMNHQNLIIMKTIPFPFWVSYHALCWVAEQTQKHNRTQRAFLQYKKRISSITNIPQNKSWKGNITSSSQFTTKFETVQKQLGKSTKKDQKTVQTQTPMWLFCQHKNMKRHVSKLLFYGDKTRPTCVCWLKCHTLVAEMPLVAAMPHWSSRLCLKLHSLKGGVQTRNFEEYALWTQFGLWFASCLLIRWALNLSPMPVGNDGGAANCRSVTQTHLWIRGIVSDSARHYRKWHVLLGR